MSGLSARGFHHRGVPTVYSLVLMQVSLFVRSWTVLVYLEILVWSYSKKGRYSDLLLGYWERSPFCKYQFHGISYFDIFEISGRQPVLKEKQVWRWSSLGQASIFDEWPSSFFSGPDLQELASVVCKSDLIRCMALHPLLVRNLVCEYVLIGLVIVRLDYSVRNWSGKQLKSLWIPLIRLDLGTWASHWRWREHLLVFCPRYAQILWRGFHRHCEVVA